MPPAGAAAIEGRQVVIAAAATAAIAAAIAEAGTGTAGRGGQQRGLGDRPPDQITAGGALGQPSDLAPALRKLRTGARYSALADRTEPLGFGRSGRAQVAGQAFGTLGGRRCG
jgi:hypothetical protein